MNQVASRAPASNVKVERVSIKDKSIKDISRDKIKVPIQSKVRSKIERVVSFKGKDHEIATKPSACW